MKEITIDLIEAWNRMREFVKGSNHYFTYDVYHECRDSKGKWHSLGWGGIRNGRIPHPSDHYFIKRVGGETYLYFEDCAGDTERWCLNPLAVVYFGAGEEK